MPNRRQNLDLVDGKEPVSKSNLLPLVKSLVDKSNLGFKPKSVKVNSSKQPKTYMVTLVTTESIKNVHLKKLYLVFKRNNMKIIDGSVLVGFTTSKLLQSCIVRFKFKILKSTKKSRFSLKLNNRGQQKVRAFVLNH